MDDGLRIVAAVRDWLMEAAGGTVALPVGAGWTPRWRPYRLTRRLRESREFHQHGDHVFTRDAVLRAARDLGAPALVLYEEQSCVWGGRGDRAARQVASTAGY